jgi:hypothetical protein
MKLNYKHSLLLLGCIFIIVYLYSSFVEGMETYTGSFDEYPLPKKKIDAKDALYTAIIIEPRKHNALEFVLNNFWDNLDERWTFVILHGLNNEDFVKNIVKKSVNARRTQLVNMGVSNLSVSQYSELFYNPLLYDYIPTETFLVFQTDAIILKENRNKVYDFMRYDYVGAPWPHDWNLLGKMSVGNGGLSLRKKSKMIKLLKLKNKIKHTHSMYGKYIAEDQFFNGYYFPNEYVSKPTFEQAQNFSIEAVYSDAPFGVHKLWMGLNKETLSKLIKRYPDIKMLMEYNNAK